MVSPPARPTLTIPPGHALHGSATLRRNCTRESGTPDPNIGELLPDCWPECRRLFRVAAQPLRWLLSLEEIWDAQIVQGCPNSVTSQWDQRRGRRRHQPLLWHQDEQGSP